MKKEKLFWMLAIMALLGLSGPVIAQQTYVAPGDITATASQDAFAHTPEMLVDQIPTRFTDPENPEVGWDSANYWHTDISPTFTSPASGNTVEHWLRFDFSSATKVARMLVWNGAANLPDRAPKDVEIYYTTDSGASWTLLTTDQWAHVDSGFSWRPASDVVAFGDLLVDGVVVDIISDFEAESLQKVLLIAISDDLFQ